MQKADYLNTMVGQRGPEPTLAITAISQQQRHLVTPFFCKCLASTWGAPPTISIPPKDVDFNFRVLSAQFVRRVLRS